MPDESPPRSVVPIRICYHERMLRPGYATLINLTYDEKGRVPLPDGRPLTPELGKVIWSSDPGRPGSPVIVQLVEPVFIDDADAHNFRLRAEIARDNEADRPIIVGH